MAFVVRGKSGKVVGTYATRGEAERRIAQLKAGAERLRRFQFVSEHSWPGQPRRHAKARRISCGVDNGISGDGRLVLAMREVRDVVPGADRSREIVPAIETNGNPIGILVDPTWSLGESAVDVAGAADLLGTTPQAIRDAVLAAWPAAAEWDWALQSWL